MKPAAVFAGLLLALASATFAADAPPAAAGAKATRAAAAWDVVPYQIFSKPFKAGVVAFHETGCKVEFRVSVAGQEKPELARTADAPTLNDQTKVWEYWIELDPKNIPDGPVELHAKIIPLGAGMIERDLAPLPLYANNNGSLKAGEPVWVDCAQGSDTADGSEGKPFKTLKAAIAKTSDGGTIYLKAGKEYSPDGLGAGFKRKYWTTIAAAPGVARDDVEIGPGRPGTEKLCFRGVTLFTDPAKRGYNTILAGEQGKTMVWLDNCKLYNKKGRWEGGGNAFGNRYVPYITGGLTTEMNDGPGAVLMRDHKIVKITSDAFTGAQTAINCSVEDINPGTTGAHPDFHQSYVADTTKFNSVILYNVTGVDCISQGFFGHNLQDSAFVNCLFHKVNTVMYSQYSGKLDHVMFFHISLPNQTFLWRDGVQTTNVYVINSLIAHMNATANADVSDLTLQSNHFIGSHPEKAVKTTKGEPKFQNVEKRNFHLAPGSPAATGGEPQQCVPADAEGRSYDAKSPARGCYAAGS